MTKKLVVSLAVLGLASCAAVQIPPDKLEGTEASIRGAEEMGATGVPDAKLLLQFAKDQTATARGLAADGDERALLVLARAQADAELALALAREAAVHRDALKAADDLRAVRARGTP